MLAGHAVGFEVPQMGRHTKTDKLDKLDKLYKALAS